MAVLRPLSGARAGSKRVVLALNCGSSSLKFGLYRSDGQAAETICEGEAEEIGKENGTYWFEAPGTQKRNEEKTHFADHAAAFARALKTCEQNGAPQAEAVGHRFVHGGPDLTEHVRLTPEIEKQLHAAVDYAPLHLPSALAVLAASQKSLPGLPQVICFDTAFHRTLPDVSRTLALPRAVRDHGVRRYGFHGLSLESIVAQFEKLPARLVVAHLGNGSSITAIRDGASIDTTMGLTPTGGVMMGTRSGDLDPGVLIFLLRHGYTDADSLEKLCDRESGLLGVSGQTSDVRALMAARQKNKYADLALRMFCYQVRQAIAAMAAALHGLDTLVFTGGIGEHAGELRAEVCDGLTFLGIEAQDGTYSRVTVLPAQEDEQIAKNTARLA